MDFISEKIAEYLSQNSEKEPEILSKLNRETHQKVLQPRMLSGHIQGRFLSLISKIKSPLYILEIGTYTGYGTLCLAEGLAAGGKIFTIDRNEELLKIQNKYFEESGNRDRIVQLTGNAIDILDNLNQTFDLIFIDADKENYIQYYNLCLDKLKSGGLIIADNVLWTGKVVDPNSYDDELTQYLIDFNEMVKNDDRVENIILPLRDGLNIIIKN